MTQLAITMLIIAGFLTLMDWRKGLAMCVFVGIAQDPLRKLAPNQPVYYVVLVGLIFAVAWVRAGLLRVPLAPSVLQGWKQNLKLPFSVFIALVLAQALHSFVRYGSTMMPLIGLLVWLAPIPAVMLAYQYALRRGALGVRRLMFVYVLLAMASMSGVYLEYVGYEWPVLGEIGEGQVIFDLGTVLKAYSGFFRASEIAAWHGAAIACFVFILSVGKRVTLFRVVLALSLIALLASLGVLTGRRKMLVEVTVFISSYVFLVAWLQRGMARLAISVLAAGAITYLAIVGLMAPDPAQRSTRPEMDAERAVRIEGYVARGRSVFADVPERMNQLGLQPVMWAVNNFGWMGAGLGTGSQGTNAIAEANNISRGPAEGGLGKATMELGVPGLLAIFWALLALSRHLRRQLITTTQLSPQHARLSYGLVAFLVANTATFSVATQAFSDLFILLILGWSAGFLLAMPVLAARGDRVKRGAQAMAEGSAIGARWIVPTPRAPGSLPSPVRDQW